jgi:hypothetical protein
MTILFPFLYVAPHVVFSFGAALHGNNVSLDRLMQVRQSVLLGSSVKEIKNTSQRCRLLSFWKEINSLKNKGAAQHWITIRQTKNSPAQHTRVLFLQYMLSKFASHAAFRLRQNNVFLWHRTTFLFN